ncbi:hypothetical protein OBBRIDRAFT_135507 [Obba rivulosa]|uniref:Histone H1 n=1 Tax=Obba rivulosa TaxID=1052685 RepID=A0A8E2DI27_9APHY|nr:hypothetical protein OBBRIDRAFT_135507 [Obba rivulosa]
MLASSTPAPSSLTGGAPSGSSLDPESEELKKTYLSLLPSVQIIEICLTLESHVPSHVRKGIWPADLQAAIYALRQTSAGNASHSDVNPSLAEDTAPTTQHVLADTLLQTPEQSTAPSLQGSKDESPPMRSLWDGMSENRMSSTPAAQDISTPGPAAAIQPQQQVPATQDAAPSAVPPAQPPPSSMIHPPSPKPSTPTASTSTAHAPANGQQASLQPLDPQSSSTTRTSTPQTQPPVPYPYAPYGYPLQPQPQQASYPHAPYFPPPPSHGYPSHYPYPGYPPPPGYPSPPPPPPTASGHAPSHPPHPASSANGHGHSLFTSTPLVRSSHPHASPHPHHHPHAPHPGMPGASGSVQSPPHPPPHSHPHPHAHAEDLPSYEDMIVEALLDTADPEGAAPKDLFAWMALRYPLQTNFRPSASQALQKAFKRGRLEKTPSGKYRLNPTWEGGAVSRFLGCYFPISTLISSSVSAHS